MHRKLTTRRILPTVVGGLLLFLAFFAGSCDSQPDAQKKEGQLRQDSYTRLARNQPARTMSYSPTRDTINFWIETWNKPGKLSYVYMQANNGQLTGYYIFRGLPVSYCASLTPTYEFADTPQDDSDVKDQQVPAPSVDGVYYSGGQCNAYYGRDATTGQYLEYTVGSGQNVLIYERPLPRQDVEPLGFTTIDEVR